MSDKEGFAVNVVDTTISERPAWFCFLCQRHSFNQNDVANEYCGCCGSPELPRNCSHRQFDKSK
jgi:ribosomal protein L37E